MLARLEGSGHRQCMAATAFRVQREVSKEITFPRAEALIEEVLLSTSQTACILGEF